MGNLRSGYAGADWSGGSISSNVSTSGAPDIDLSGSSGVFKSTTGTNTLGGNVVVSGSKTFTVGTGTATFGGAMAVTGNYTSTAGDLTLTGGDLAIGGVSAFTGKVTCNGDLEVVGATTLNGNLTLGDDAADTLTISATPTVSENTAFQKNVDIAGTLTVAGATTHNGATILNGNVSIGNASTDTVQFTADVASSVAWDAGAYNIDMSAATGTFDTSTGVNTLNGDVTVATTKDLVLGSGTAIGGTFTIYQDGAGNKSFEIVPATSITLNENTTLSGATTLTTGTGDTTISGDLVLSGHKDNQEFMANAFQYPAPGTDWTPEITGAVLGANQSTKKVWLPLNFVKIGDEIVSYKLVGDVHEEGGDTVTVDCKLVKVNKADPLTTTDVTGGGITQVTADGNFDSEAVLSAVETVATDQQYLLEINATTSNVSTNEAVKVIGAEVKVNRK